MNDLIPDIKTSDMVAAYQAMVSDMEAVLDLLSKVDRTGKLFFGDGYSPCNLNGRPISLITYDGQYTRDNIRRDIVVNCWTSLFNRIKNFLPEREIKAIEKQIQEKMVPEFCEHEINKILLGFINRGEEFKRAMVQDVFDFLRPQRTLLKTNKRVALTDKAIIPYAFDDWKYGCHLSSYRENSLWDMDKLFHLLDGQGMPKFPGNLITKIQDATRAKQWETETEYFALKWHKNRNLHIRFKRMDLVNEINRLAGCDKLSNQSSPGEVDASDQETSEPGSLVESGTVSPPKVVSLQMEAFHG